MSICWVSADHVSFFRDALDCLSLMLFSFGGHSIEDVAVVKTQANEHRITVTLDGNLNREKVPRNRVQIRSHGESIRMRCAKKTIRLTANTRTPVRTKNMPTLTWHHEQTETTEFANLMPIFRPNTRKIRHQKPNQTLIIANNTLIIAASKHSIATTKPSIRLTDTKMDTTNWTAAIPALISTANFCYSMKIKLNLLICHASNSTSTFKRAKNSASFSRKFTARTNFGFTSKTMQKILTRWCMDWSEFWFSCFFLHFNYWKLFVISF